jgi:hypothetical protein
MREKAESEKERERKKERDGGREGIEGNGPTRRQPQVWPVRPRIEEHHGTYSTYPAFQCKNYGHTIGYTACDSHPRRLTMSTWRPTSGHFCRLCSTASGTKARPCHLSRSGMMSIGYLGGLHSESPARGQRVAVFSAI